MTISGVQGGHKKGWKTLVQTLMLKTDLKSLQSTQSNLPGQKSFFKFKTCCINTGTPEHITKAKRLIQQEVPL